MTFIHHLRGLFWFLVPCSLFLFVSCQSESDDTSAPDGKYTVTFSVSNYRQVNFDDLAASAATRADIPTDHPSTLAHLLVAVFNAETGQQACPSIQHDQKDYENNNDEYPKFSVSLPYGHYRVLILGFNGSRGCNISSLNHVSWEDGYVPNTFLYCEEFVLDKNTNLDQKITLKHVVSAFRVTAEDAIPAELKKMRFNTAAGGIVLDATTGFALQTTGRTSDITVPDDYSGKQGVDFTAYIFLPEEQTTGNYTVQALGKNDNVLYERHFKDVPLRINVLTMWKGKFFEESPDDEEHNMGLNLYWDTQWADTLKI